MIPSRFVYPSPGFGQYWNLNHGKNLLSTLDCVPNESSIREKIPLLYEYDVVAEKVIEELYIAKGYKVADSLIENAFSSGIENTPDAPESLTQLFKQINSKPDWLDTQKMELGAAFCRRSGLMGLIVLRNYCLMGGYESAAINKPLIFTEALKKGAAKRIAETVDFWVNITGEHAMNVGSIGFKHTVKVRLLHAYAKFSILKNGNWSTDKWGTPLNQWDMVATNLGFSIAFLDGLEKIGVVPNKQEEESLFHFWKYIGYLLGINSNYLPDTKKQAIAELYKWTMSQAAGDEDTIALAVALQNEPLNAPFPKRTWQKKILVQINLSYNHFFLGERSCTLLGLSNPTLRYFPYIAKVLNTLENLILKTGLFKNAAEKLGRKSQVKVKNSYLDAYAKQKQHTATAHASEG